MFQYPVLQLLQIRVGVLGGSAVEASVRNISSNVYRASQRNIVPSTDAAIPMLMWVCRIRVEKCPDPRRLIVFGNLSACGPDLASWSTLMDVTRYFWSCILFLFHRCLCIAVLWPLRFCWLFVRILFKEDYLRMFKSASFWMQKRGVRVEKYKSKYKAFVVRWKIGYL